MTNIKKNTKCYITKRYIVTFMGFLGFCNVYGMRINLSVAIVAMTNSTRHTVDPNNSIAHSPTDCPYSSDTGNEISRTYGQATTYNWDAKTQGHIISAFYYCYFVAMVPGGYLAERYGAIRIYGWSILMTSILTIISPFVVQWGVWQFMLCRSLEGLVGGLAYPSMNVIISKWSPKLERSRISSVVFGGGPVGIVATNFIAGLLSSTDLLGGWPSIFYVSGAVGCLWYLLWLILIYEDPHSHPTISQEEISMYHKEQKDRVSVPWKKLFTSVPLWSLTVTHFGHYFYATMFNAELPTYLTKALHFNIKSSGLLSALPYVLQALAAGLWSIMADKIRSSGKLSTTAIRKLFNSIAAYGACICLVCVTFCGCNAGAIVALFCIAMFLHGARYSGYHVTHVDMCPEIAGTLFGITDTMASWTGILGPSLVGIITANGATIANWSKVFYLTTGILGGTATIFLIFGSAEPQEWLRTEKSDKEQSPGNESYKQDQ